MTKIGLLFNEPLPQGVPNWESSVDVMVQVDAIERALVELGHIPVRIPFTRDLGTALARINVAHPQLVLNLCETVDEDPLLAGHPAAVLELLGLPFSGSSALALLISTDKVTVKYLLRGAGLPTPPFFLYEGGEIIIPPGLCFPVILKPRFQEASIGIAQESVITQKAKLDTALHHFYDQYGSILVEEYVEGREFNIALFGYPKALVMPLAEIDFSEFPPDLHRIVSYKAKWDEDSFEYQNTTRCFPDNLPHPLQSAMCRVAEDGFALFGLRDYGRIDLRLDALGRINILEVNANPCLSPDAGFTAAVAESKMTYTEMVGEFIRFVAMRAAL